jgi:hypothetical protein
LGGEMNAERTIPRVAFGLPLLAAFVVGVAGFRHFRFLTQVAGIPADSPVMIEEQYRWILVAGATFVVSLAVVLATVVSVRSTLARTLRVVLLIVVFIGSCYPAYYPERELVRAGWYVHPPRLAIHLPWLLGAATGLVMFVIQWRRSRPVPAA